jgi:hypothetical protein
MRTKVKQARPRRKGQIDGRKLQPLNGILGPIPGRGLWLRFATSSTRRRFRLSFRCRSYHHADYVFVQYVQDFLGLIQADSVQEFEAKLNATERGNGVMVGANLDDDRTTLPANAKTNTCLFNPICSHELHLNLRVSRYCRRAVRIIPSYERVRPASAIKKAITPVTLHLRAIAPT